MLRALVIISLVLGLSACGFQLRGTGAPPLDVERVMITGSAVDLIDELEETLKTIGVAVGTADPEYRINIANERLTRRAVASSGAITVSEYEVRVATRFNISDADGEILIPDAELVTERVYSFDTANFVSNTEEEAILVSEMRRDIAGQLVRRFSAVLRNASESNTGS